jgi:hypothetical protein
VLFQPLAIESLTRQADLVLQGTVLSKTVQRDPTGRIYTAVELKVAEVWKGAIGNDPFLIVHGGGVLGEEESVVSGQVQYEVGEEVVAFLVHNQRGEGVTLGLMQGKFHVWQDARTGTRLAANPFHGILEPTGSNVSAKSAGVTAPLPGTLTLPELKRRVMEAGQ